MKHLKSSSKDGKRVVLFFLISLFVFCASMASAQDGNRRQISYPERQTETMHATDAEVVFEHNRFAETSEDAFSKSRINEFSPTRFDGKYHGIVETSFIKTAIEAPEAKHEFRAAPKIEFNDKENFFPVNDNSFARHSKTNIKANNLLSVGENSPFVQQTAGTGKFKQNKDFFDDSLALDSPEIPMTDGFRWRPAIQQALLFLAVQHGYAMTQPKTRDALKGNFFGDYVKSVKALRGWEDGGRFFTNYIAHPMQGSFVGFIQVQNDPKGMKQRFGGSGSYWRSRMKAMAWSAAWSTQFEIGPISQASIGNVGLKGKQTYVDLVMTPTLGTAMLITEDALDRFIIERIERSANNFYLRIFSRILLNPTRTVANLIRFKHPWHRDRARVRQINFNFFIKKTRSF
jgi:hypothetical protein